jgi:hypothetical protein
MAIQFTNGFSVTPNNRSLYDFTTFTFTNVSVTGSNPPLLTQFLAAYTGSATWTANSAYFTTQSGYLGYQVWTVPQTATYEIEVAGASSGRGTHAGLPVSGAFSSGSKMRARFSLQQNQKLLIVVGQQSANASQVATYTGLGGGGGTFVVPSASNSSSIIPLIIAGGGGGIGAWSSALPVVSGSQIFGRTTTYGGNAAFFEIGGRNGTGGRSHISSSANPYDGGGGGGFAVGISGSGVSGLGVYNGPGSTNNGGGGKGFWTGSVGGGTSTSYPPPGTSTGGFGGGGGAGPICGGGGGGYSGGAGSARATSTLPDSGGGGGSYISSSGTNVATADGLYDTLSTFSGSAITTIGYQSGSGYVKITKL